MNYLCEIKYIENAALREDTIKKALNEFMHAVQVEEPFTAVTAEFYIGVCYALLNENQSALRWYERSYLSADFLSLDLSERIHRPEDDINLTNFLLAISLVGAPLGAYRIYKRIKESERIENTFHEVCDFKDLMEDLISSFIGEAEMQQLKDRSWEEQVEQMLAEISQKLQ